MIRPGYMFAGLALALAAIVLVAGCVSTGTGPAPPAQNQSQPGAGASQPDTTQNLSGNGSGGAANVSCDSYCRTLPHVQCEGEWNISGTYPGCVCGFECQSAEPQDGPDAGEPLATPTNLSISEMLEGGLDAQAEEFYRANDGEFSERTYTWRREGQGGGFLGGTVSPATDVKFEGEAVSSIRAAGFTVFENSAGGSDRAWGLAIFNASSTALDSYTGGDTFGITFFPSMIDKELMDCWIYSKDFNLDSQGGWMLTYYFKCDRAVDR